MLVLSACIRQDYLIDLTSKPAPETRYEISILEIGGVKARVQVTHNGSNGDYYMVFCTDDLDSPISEVYQQVIKDRGEVYYYNQRKVVVNFKVPELSTVYRVIVCSITPDNTIDFTSATELLFKTNEVIGFVAQTPSNLQIDFSDDILSKVSLTVSGELMKDYFFVSVLTEDEINEYDNIETLLGCKAYDFMKAYEHNMSTAVKYMYHSDYSIDIKLKKGRQAVYAIGINDDGLASGYYAATEMIEVEIPEYIQEIEGKFALKGNQGKVFDVCYAGPDSLVIKGFTDDGSLDIGLSYYEQDILEDWHLFSLGSQVQYDLPAMSYGVATINDLGIRAVGVKKRYIDENGDKRYTIHLHHAFHAYYYNSTIRIFGTEEDIGFAVVGYDYVYRRFYILDYYNFPFVIEKIQL